MIIIGAGGFARELVDVCKELNLLDGLAFYDDLTPVGPKTLYNFPILSNQDELKLHFEKGDRRFALGIGKPTVRAKIATKITALGGELTSLISPSALIGQFDVTIGNGATILSKAVIANGSQLGVGVLMYPHTQITHDCSIGDFVEISPGATVLGASSIDNFSSLGANSTVLPNVSIGQHCIIGAGAVVTKNVADHSVAIGVPAKAHQKPN